MKLFEMVAAGDVSPQMAAEMCVAKDNCLICLFTPSRCTAPHAYFFTAVKKGIAPEWYIISNLAENKIENKLNSYLNFLKSKKIPSDYYISQNGSLTLEWNAPNEKLSVFFHEDDKFCGWSYLSNIDMGGKIIYGDLSSLETAPFENLY